MRSRQALFNSLVAKLATVEPFFAKQLAAAALRRLGTTPEEVTAVELLAIVQDEIDPRLRRRKKLFASLLDSGDTYALFGQDGALLEMSPALRRLLPDRDLPDEAIVARLGIRPPDFGTIAVQQLEIPAEERSLLIRWVRLADTAAGCTAILALVHDATLEKELLGEVRASYRELAQTHAALHARSQFLANMSHEIRTPMNAILGMTELAMDTELTAQQREYLSMVRDSAEALLTVINDILDFSKIEAGKLDLDAVDFSLEACVGDALRVLAVRAHQKQIDLISHMEPEVPDRLKGDPHRLRQIIINLVGNAIRFTEKGEVSVHVAVETQSASDCRLHVTIRDTGIGIPPERQEAIFEAFSQADPSVARKYGGTGLGLTISAQLVQMMGGRIWVESQVGLGSQFHFTVRFDLASERGDAPVLHEALNGLRTLIVDDSATNRQVLDRIIRSLGMTAEVAEGGEAALRRMRQAATGGDPFRLALIDVQMPEMDGFTLVERIQTAPELAQAAVVMMSSVGSRGEFPEARTLKIAAYLTKPVRRSELLEAVLAAIGEGARRRPDGADGRQSPRAA